jgi:putative SOS response-associated peptidase YedK
MCGRYASFRAEQDLADEFALDAVAEDAAALPPSWNLAPTDPVRIVVDRADRTTGTVTRQLRAARWGLVPPWAKDPSIGSRMINARAETLADKPAFARPFAARRALLPADGYYEWQAAPARPGTGRRAKQPYWIRPTDGSVAALAGLYEFWQDPARAADDPLRWLVSTTVVTRPADSRLAQIHERCPLILPREHWDAWLSPGLGADQARALLAVRPPALTATPVSTLVNDVAHDGPALIEPVPPDD